MVFRTDEHRAFYRFYDKVLVGDECWEWQGNKLRGYGQFWHDGKTVRAHRWAYEYHVGTIPDGLQIDHICENPSCVRWDHLMPATPKENIARYIASGRAHKTHCKRGHLFTDATTQWRPDGRRYCKECVKDKRGAAHRRNRTSKYSTGTEGDTAAGHYSNKEAQ